MSKLIFLLLLTCSSAFANQAPDHFSFTFVTTKGDINFECPKGWAPLGQERLFDLIGKKFFENISVFRMITGFVAQFGKSGDPAVVAAWSNATIADDPVIGSNVAGVLSFATAGPNTRTTQLFINVKDNSRLDNSGFSPVCRIADAARL